MTHRNSLQTISVSALLIAIGIVIPMFCPFKLVLEPASFTLASHVAIFIAMLISPVVAVAVAIGTTLGFLLGGFPIVIVMRAATHLIFALIGAIYIKKNPNIFKSQIGLRVFSFVIGIIHAVAEVAAVSAFFFGGNMNGGYYQHGYVKSVLILVGVGTVIHSMVDFEIALAIAKVLQKQKSFSDLIGPRTQS